MGSKDQLSIDIGSDRIKIVQGYYRKGEFSISKIGNMQLSKHYIENEYVKNPDDLAKEISDFLKAEKFKAKNSIITVKAVEAVIRDIDLPKCSPKELRPIIKNEMIHSYHANETNMIQYKLIDLKKDEKGNQANRYRVASVNCEMINGYQELLKKSKLNPIAMDINVNCIDKMIKVTKSINDYKMANKTILLIDFGAVHTSVYIYSAGNQKVFRHLDIGSAEIEKKISDGLFISTEEAKKMKEEEYNFLVCSSENEQYYTVLKSYFYNLVEELRNLIRFYNDRVEQNTIDQVFTMGGGSSLFGLTEYLQTNLNIETQSIQNIVNVKAKKQNYDLHEYLNALGALIRL